MITVINEEDFDINTVVDEMFEKHGIDQVATERRFNKSVADHYIKMPRATEPGFYRAVVSMGAFQHRELDRVFGEKARRSRKEVPFYYALQRRQELEVRYAGHVHRYGQELRERLPIIEHESIWDFYKYIGYDYKKKRFVEKS